MTLRYTLGLRKLAYESHDNCSVCRRSFVKDETYRLGYDSDLEPIVVGDCCKSKLNEIVAGHHYSPRRFQVPDDQADLWRYMDLAKFISLLSGGSLYFPRMDCFDDPFECAIGLGEHREWYEEAKHAQFVADVWAVVNEPIPGHPLRSEEARRENAERLIAEYEKRRNDPPVKLSERCHASCWHESSYESEALWKLYGGVSGQAVAIKTTYRRLRDSLLDRNEEGDRYEIDIGKVAYIDYSEGFLHHLESPFRKRKAFEHEKEVRAVITPHRARDYSEPSKGICVPIDLAVAVQEVIVSPLAPSWFHEIVADVGSRYSASINFSQSELRKEPLHLHLR